MDLSSKVSNKANLIWAIADKITGVYKPHEYGKVILPLTVIKRFDSILEDTKQDVLEAHKKYGKMDNETMRDHLLRQAAKRPFYNTSNFTLTISSTSYFFALSKFAYFSFLKSSNFFPSS